MKLVHHLLEQAAQRWPQHEAVVLAEALAAPARQARWSYRQLNQQANQLARWLVARGVRPGDPVALLAPNGPFYVVAFFAILKAGGTAIPLSSTIDGSTLLHQLALCPPRALLVGARAERVIVETGARLSEGGGGAALAVIGLATETAAPALTATGVAAPVVVLEGCGELAAQPDADLALGIDDQQPAMVIFTSGSTGKPRGAALRHRGMRVNVDGVVRSLALTQDDRVLVVLPLSYVFGKSLLTMCFAVGATAVLENRFQYPKTALDTVEAERCTGIAGVPSTFAILAHRTDLGRRALPALRWMAQAGGGMSPTLIRELIALRPAASLYIMYGATEGSGRLSCLPAEELAGAIGSIGRAIDGVTLTVEREDGGECAVGEVGELVARGENIMSGYVGDPEATSEVLSARGYATGDLAYRDERGLLWLVGRKRDMLKVGGHRVGAREIEDALLEHEGVSEAAVIGVPDELLGDRLVGYVVLRRAPASDGPSLIEPKALQAFLQGRLAPHKIPSAIILCAELPKNEAGKVMKNDLLRRWSAHPPAS